MDIQVYLSLKEYQEKLPIEVFFGGTVATKARVWGAQRLSGFRSVVSSLLSNPSRTPPP
jgi:serine protease inhibitor ecotin